MSNINASLFAHIQNDAVLKGTYKLEGQEFSLPIKYFQDYLATLPLNSIPQPYIALAHNLNYLRAINEQVLSFKDNPDPLVQIENLGDKVKSDLSKLQTGETLLIPGGWQTPNGGHAMIYQFTRVKNGYNFIVINSGEGIRYHEKKSSFEKELFNPAKTWFVPLPTTEKEDKEIGAFITRLLKQRAHFLPKNQRTSSASELYKKILTSISYIGGREIKSSVGEHAYTGGQLSGTCTQRCIHQMLKINSPSAQDYERFIFEFKQYALLDYVKACFLDKTQPYTGSVKKQITLAIENNLKILNASKAFSKDEIKSHLDTFEKIKNQIKATPIAPRPSKKLFSDPPIQIKVNGFNPTTNLNFRFNSFSYQPIPPLLTNFPNDSTLLTDIKEAVKAIQALKSPAMQYYELEQLIMKLPDDITSMQLSLNKENCEAFYEEVTKIQALLTTLQKTWLKNSQIPSLNVMVLCVASLQMDIRNFICKKKKLPSFNPFVANVLHSLVNNKKRNPFYATNNPILDLKFRALKKRFAILEKKSRPEEFYDYLKTLLAKDPALNADLKKQYDRKYAEDNSLLHNRIRDYQLESLHMLFEQMPSTASTQIADHYQYEANLRDSINPFFATPRNSRSLFQFKIQSNELILFSPLIACYCPYQAQSQQISRDKYLLQDSSAYDALCTDVTGVGYEELKIRSANEIQLRPINEEKKSSLITERDKTTRDYLHLRSVPSLQIPLTLSYFTRHIDRLSDLSNQSYVMANFFQPGLLANVFKNKDFSQQFNRFLNTGFFYFNKEGKYTVHSIFFLHLHYKVSRYFNLMTEKEHKEVGAQWLIDSQQQVMEQLRFSHTEEIRYALQQHLFLILMTRIESEESSPELFAQAFAAYHYIQSHSNPCILEDKSHSVEVEAAIAKFQLLIGRKSEPEIINILSSSFPKENIKSKRTFPIYSLQDNEGKSRELNVILGKIFEKGLARTGLPLALKCHPLMKHLGLENEQECLMSADGSIMQLFDKYQTQLYYENNKLIIQKNWIKSVWDASFELQPLTINHLAASGNPTQPAQINLPRVLTDGTMDYWQTNNRAGGLLVKNNLPVYLIFNKKFLVLDKNGEETEYQLSSLSELDRKSQTLINNFEGSEFIVFHTHKTKESILHLPRYNLQFTIDNNKRDKTLVHSETHEEVVECPSPIHSSVAGLMLSKDGFERYLVPITRFYATTGDEDSIGDYYPVVHDTQARISETLLESEWTDHPPVKKPLWNYQGSEHYLSFRIEDKEPVADTPADALYLAYLYLGTHQPKKAWKILEDCNTRLGGLTGSPEELKFISWICEYLPYLPDSKEKAKKGSPPYVACQLKATSLLCDFLLQNRTFNLVEPKSKETANDHYAHLEYKNLVCFQNSLPQTIYKNFSRLQKMRRHLSHHYKLSTLERKRLLEYYHQKHPAQGTLGYEQLTITLETLLQEKEMLLAQAQSNTLSEADKKRLTFIEERLKKLKPVTAVSTEITQQAIDLSIPLHITINKSYLTDKATLYLEKFKDNLTLFPFRIDKKETEEALKMLLSTVNEEDFLKNFQVYLHIASSGGDHERQTLSDFCTKTLLTYHHTPLNKQESSIPLLCNLLYRVLSNKERLNGLPSIMTLETLIQELSNFPVPELRLYQAKDIYQDILATPETILNRPRPLHLPLNTQVLQETGLLAQVDIKACLKNDPNHSLLNELISKYRITQEKEAQILANTNSEEEAGKQIFALEQEQKVLATSLIDQKEIAVLIQAIIATQPSLLEKAEKAWEDALNFAKRGPKDPILAEQWRIEQKSKSRAPLTKADLKSLYCQADTAFSIEKTGLDAEEAQKLHHLIHEALFKDIQGHLVHNIENHLEKALKNKDPSFAMQILDVLSRETLPGLDKPATVIIQHEEEILLRTRQVNAIKSLLMPKESVEKIIPGGGKSKVIFPVLAEEMAKGDNLVVIEVPAALLKTNHIDFNRTSQRLFKKRAYRFEYNRDSDSSSKYFKKIYNQFIEVMTTRSYLVTAGESMQSLELKYLELLFSKDRSKEWEKQVYWCDNIVKLLRNHTDCIMDEIHQGLWIKKKLNYTLGDSKPLDPSLRKNSIALYNLIDPQFIKIAPTLPDNYKWDSFKTELASKLVLSANSPLYSFAERATLSYGSGVKNELMDYLTNKAEKVPEAVRQATTKEKESLAFFKRQVSELLQGTLCRKFNARYGASKYKNLSPIKYTLAIPYAGNNDPREESRIGNEIEAMNLTIQMMYIEGISRELFKDHILQLQALARQELLQTPRLKHLDNTPTAYGFHTLEKTYTLSQIDVDNSDQMEGLFQRHQYNRFFISAILESSLKQISHDSALLHSDAFSHVDLYRSVRGGSGTLNNHTTFHQRLDYNPKSSLGSDDYIVEILKNKKTPLSTLDYLNPVQFIQAALNNSTAPERVRSLIDINATFTGVSNVEVARAIAEFIKKEQKNNPHRFSPPIKHVLYFNDDQVLCALEVDNPQKTIVLGTSNEKEINRLLGSTPKERFTYYDQMHTLGTDITQAENAHAIVLTDERDSFQGLIQGNMRMRGIAQNQTLEFILPTRLKGMQLQELVDRLKENDKKTLWLDNLLATKGQMVNLLRRRALSFIQDIPSKDACAKANAAQIFEQFFIETPSLNLFELYGALNKKQALANILTQYKNQLFSSWKACCQKLNSPFVSEKEIENYLDKIIEKATPYCLPEYEATEEMGSNTTKEIQKEVRKEIVSEKSSTEYFNPQLTAAPQSKWKGDIKEIGIEMNKLCKEANYPSPLFFNTLNLSKNYIQTYTTQGNIFNPYLKPVFLILYHMEETTLHATIITPQELYHRPLAKQIKNSSGLSWVTTTDGTVVKGKPPENIFSNTDYHALNEQVRFFNGEFKSLLEQETALYWLNKDTEEKITFFETALQAFRPHCETELHQLKVALTQSNMEGFVYISEHPFDDFTEFNWKEYYPKVIPAQITEYKKVAEIFSQLNSPAMRYNSIDQIQASFPNLPLNSLVFIDKHLSYLTEIKTLFNRICSNPLHPFLTDLSKEDTATLEKCLGTSIADFCQNSVSHLTVGINSSDKTMIACIEAFTLFSKCPILKEENAKIYNYFNLIAQKTSSPTVLSSLLELGQPADNLIETILKNNASNDAVIQILSKFPLSNTLLMQTIAKSTTKQSAQEILKRDDLTDTTLQILLDNNNELDLDLLLKILQRAKTGGILLSIYEYPYKNPILDEALYKHSLFSKGILMEILAKRPNDNDLLLIFTHFPVLDREVLAGIAQRTKNETLLLNLIKHPKADSVFLKTILMHPLLTPAMVIEIAQKAILPQGHDILKLAIEKIFTFKKELIQNTWENAIIEILKKYQSQKAMGLEIVDILKKNSPISARLSVTCLIIFGNSILNIVPLKEIILTSNKDVLKLLLSVPENFSPEILRLLARECEKHDLIICFIQRNDLDNTLLEEILGGEALSKAISSGSFEPSMANTIINKSPLPQEHALLMRMALRIIECHTAIDASLKAPWEDSLIHLIEKYSNSPEPSHLKELENLIKQLKVSSPKLAIAILNCFGKEMVNYLPLKETITSATDQADLKILTNSEKTGALSEEILLLLVQQCEGEAIDHLLKREDLIDNVLQKLLNKATLTESQVTLVVEKALTSATLQLIYSYNKVTENIKAKIYQHKEFNEQFLASLVNIDGSGLTSIAKNTVNEGVLLALISHPKATATTLQTVIKNKIFSPAVALKLAEITLLPQGHALIEELILHLLALNASPETQWEKVLISLFKKYQNQPEELLIIELIKTNKPTSLSLNMALLGIFGNLVLEYIPLREIILSANEERLKLLLDSKKTGAFSQPILLLLAEQCQKYGLLIEFLQRSDLDDSILGMVLQNKLLLDSINKESFTTENTSLLINKSSLPREHPLLIPLTVKTLERYTKNQENWEATLTQIFEKYSHCKNDVCLGDIQNYIKPYSKEFTPKLSISILNYFGKEMLAYLAFKDMLTVAAADKALLAVLINEEKTGKLSEENLLLLAKICVGESINLLLKRSDLTEKVLQTLLEKEALSESQLILILQKAQTPATVELIISIINKSFSNNAKMNEALSSFASKSTSAPVLATVFSKTSKPSEDLYEIILNNPVCNEPTAESILNLSPSLVFNENTLVNAANRTQNEVILSAILSHPKAGTLLIDSIISREALAQETLEVAFKLTLPYELMQKILTHRKLSEPTCLQWLKSLDEHSQSLKQKAALSSKPIHKLHAALEALKVKACSHAIKAMKNEGYKPAATTALQLYRDLRTTWKNPDLSLNDRRKNCQELINNAKGVLGTHRGYKQILLDIVNAILAVLSFYKLKEIPSGKWRFFEANTASAHIVEHISDSMESIDDSDKNIDFESYKNN